jgi:hypothetical protein
LLDLFLIINIVVVVVVVVAVAVAVVVVTQILQLHVSYLLNKLPYTTAQMLMDAFCLN